MKFGSPISVMGSLLVLLGGFLLPWQTFELAGVTAFAFQLPPMGQAVTGLAGLIAFSSLLSIFTRRRTAFASASLVLSAFLIGWMVMANVLRGSDLFYDLQSFETVSMGLGYTVAAWGTFFAFFGALGTLAVEPALDPAGQFLRVALLWDDTVLEERVLREPQTFRIGEGLRNDLVLPAPHLADRFPLFRARSKGRYEIGLSSDLVGEITVNQETRTVAEFAKDATAHQGGVDFVPVEAGDWGMVRMEEGLSVFFQFIQPEERVKKAGMFAFDEAVVAAIGVSFVLQLGFLLFSIFLWEEDAYRVVQHNERRPYQVDISTLMEKQKDPLVEDDGDTETVSKKAGGAEGTVGDPDEDPNKVSKIPKNEGRMVDKLDPKAIGLTDLLSSNNALNGAGAVAAILNESNEGWANKIAVAMAGDGREFVMGHGTNGLGFKGTESGGGGESPFGRLVGAGNIDTGSDRGTRVGLKRKKVRKVGTVTIRQGSAKGFCKKSNIQSVVRRRAGAIRACYEKRLQVKPKLGGKISARWTITAKGSVSAAGASGSLKDGAVVNCVLRTIRRMRFAKPEGGICVIRWPFVFNAGG